MEAEQAFKDLLLKRNIDPEALLARQPAVYRRWLDLFWENHPESFLGLVRNEINAIRRQLKGLPLQRFGSESGQRRVGNQEQQP